MFFVQYPLIDNFELIVVDAVSTDNTADAFNDFDDERVKYICHEKNRGLAASRNTGIKFSVGDFILFHFKKKMMSGRLKKLEKEINLIKNSEPNVGVVYSGYVE